LSFVYRKFLNFVCFLLGIKLEIGNK